MKNSREVSRRVVGQILRERHQELNLGEKWNVEDSQLGKGSDCCKMQRLDFGWEIDAVKSKM